MKARITSYIRQNFGEDVLSEVVKGTRTVTLNGVKLDGTAKNFRDKRVTDGAKVEISDKTSSYAVEVIETAVDHANHEEVKTEISEPIVATEEPPIEVVETPITVETTVRTKRHYQRIRENKSIPEGAILHTSKSGKQYYEKVIGEERYV